jgi:hypothetical protein
MGILIRIGCVVVPVIILGLLAFGAALAVLRELAILVLAALAGLVIGLGADCIASVYAGPLEEPVGTFFGLIAFLAVYGTIQWRRWRKWREDRQIC